MRQAVSEIISVFFSPVSWIILLIILQYVIKRPGWKKIFRILAIAIFVVFSNGWLLNRYAKYWQPGPRDTSSDTPYSCGILLGGFGSPGEDGKTGYFNSSADRFIQAVKLYKMGKIQHILISGGNGKRIVKQFNEGEWTKDEFKAMDIPAEAILLEDRSENTADNALNTKKLLEAANLKAPYLLITSAQHIPRASLLYKHAGIQTVAFPCNYNAGRETFNFRELIPQPGILFGWEPFIKETVSYFLYWLKGK